MISKNQVKLSVWIEEKLWKWFESGEKKQFKPSQSIQKQHSKTETPLLLWGFDSLLQNYILAMSNHAAVIS